MKNLSAAEPRRAPLARDRADQRRTACALSSKVPHPALRAALSRRGEGTNTEGAGEPTGGGRTETERRQRLADGSEACRSPVGPRRASHYTLSLDSLVLRCAGACTASRRQWRTYAKLLIRRPIDVDRRALVERHVASSARIVREPEFNGPHIRLLIRFR